MGGERANTLRFGGGEKIALEDIARFIAPKRPKRALSILNCFYGGEGLTAAEIMKETGMREKALRYYITKLKRWKILWTHRRWMMPAVYHVEAGAFHARVDSVLVDPLKNLSHQRGPLLHPTDVKPAPPTRFVPEATGRCHSCDIITKTNSDNRCQVCFEGNGGAIHG